MNRLVVVGAAGSGKTTVARSLADAWQVSFTDLDSLFWGPGWSRVPTERFRDRAAARVRGDRWLVAGNFFAQAADLVWPHADTVVWLDLDRSLSFTRVVRRTMLQTIRREELFPGCRQSLHAAWRDGLFTTAWHEPERNRHLVPELLARPENGHLTLVRLQSRSEVSRWLAAARHRSPTRSREQP